MWLIKIKDTESMFKETKMVLRSQYLIGYVVMIWIVMIQGVTIQMLLVF